MQFVETQINSINKVNLGTEYVLRLKKVIEVRLAWVTEILFVTTWIDVYLSFEIAYNLVRHNKFAKAKFTE